MEVRGWKDCEIGKKVNLRLVKRRTVSQQPSILIRFMRQRISKLSRIYTLLWRIGYVAERTWLSNQSHRRPMLPQINMEASSSEEKLVIHHGRDERLDALNQSLAGMSKVGAGGRRAFLSAAQQTLCVCRHASNAGEQVDLRSHVGELISRPQSRVAEQIQEDIPTCPPDCIRVTFFPQIGYSIEIDKEVAKDVALPSDLEHSVSTFQHRAGRYNPDRRPFQFDSDNACYFKVGCPQTVRGLEPDHFAPFSPIA